MCQNTLRDARLIPALLKIDEELAAETRRAGCPCGGVLHTANYARKPRGGAGMAADDRACAVRLSLCCNLEGCRRRRTPPSVRFLGRRVYLGAVVVLVTAMFHGLTAGRARRIRELFGVGERTLGRWRKWWRETFTGTTFWKSARALFSPPVDDATLPSSMLDRFGGQASFDALIGTLRFLSPITTSWRPKEASSTMGA